MPTRICRRLSRLVANSRLSPPELTISSASWLKGRFIQSPTAMIFMKKLLPFFALVFGLVIAASVARAQDNNIDVSKIPTVADRPEQFAPAGWKLEEAF